MKMNWEDLFTLREEILYFKDLPKIQNSDTNQNI